MAWKKKDGWKPSEFQRDEGGMSLRDWFAGKVLVGLCQADMSEEEFTVSPELMARTAYRMADAMLAEREKDNG